MKTVNYFVAVHMKTVNYFVAVHMKTVPQSHSSPFSINPFPQTFSTKQTMVVNTMDLNNLYKINNNCKHKETEQSLLNKQ